MSSRRGALVLVAAVLSVVPAFGALGQAAQPSGAPGPVPSLEEVRKKMAIPSAGETRGQMDGVGYATTAEQMKKVWELSAAPPAPEALGAGPPAGSTVAAAIAPHDDYIYAGRVYRQVLPLVTAKTVVIIGAFHGYRKFDAHDALVFDTYRSWRSPDGPIKVSLVRDELVRSLPKADVVTSAAMHDGEHSIEAVAYWLKHETPDLEIVPILVPAATFDRMKELADHLGTALVASMRKLGWSLGKDLAIVVSSDAVHYGPDFKYVPYGDGGEEAYKRACEKDRALITHPLAGPVSIQKAHGFFSSCVNPKDPSEYRLTWCGRFSVPLGLLTLERMARALEIPPPKGYPIAYATSVSAPGLPLKDAGLGVTAPAGPSHFVGYPAVAYALQ